ncbi:MAG TPA: extracellular solute-binding protein [Candidatus Binatia bacterium]|jgi:ABC-type Fe3+ transport system substrate-binding protein|nr:extracellular solute-binding protein [Candidatus Binatia bacterium]
MRRAIRSLSLFALSVAFCVQAVFSSSALAGEQPATQQLQKLVDGARKEGQLNVSLVSSLTEAGARELNDAFNRRFNLKLKFNTTLGETTRQFPQVMEELKMGLPPSFDSMYVSETYIVHLIKAGGVERIDNWSALLKEISPEAYRVANQLSPLDLKGYAFAWGTRAKVINYNTDLISERELPPTHVEMGHSKYAGTYFMPPFITEAEYGVLVYPKDRWLEIVRSWGNSKPPILNYEAGLQRMFLGEFKFAPSNDYYMFKHKGRDPKTPVGLAFFKDFTPLTYAWHVARKGAKNPNAAKLFALWATSPEANRIFENLDYSATGNLLLNTGPMSRQIKDALDKRNIKLISWWDNEKNADVLEWYASEEGRTYKKELSAAQTGRRR